MKSLYFLLGPYAEEPEWGAPPRSVKRYDTVNDALLPLASDLTDPQSDE